LVYLALTDKEPGKVGTFLEASFDLGGPKPPPDNRYYVPRSCGQCHGTVDPVQKAGKVNYLDTDHWFDRIQKDDDFPKVSPRDVLVDGAPGAYSPLRVLNQEIARQNQAVVGTGPKFALLAANKWLELHKPGSATETQHVPAIQRGFRESPSDPVWTPGNPTDEKLLPLLNRNCFRCHSSVNFHVFEKKAIKDRARGIKTRIGLTSSAKMPQDRILQKETIDEIKTRVEELEKQP
jgi:hypothetical protein